MRTTSFSKWISAAVVALALFFAVNLIAQPASSGDLLRQAYVALEQADHDYNGRRVAAMKQIRAAGKVLGVELKGNAKVHENQAVSDQQLRSAIGLLEQARPGVPVKAQKHVDRAIKDLNVALSIK